MTDPNFPMFPLGAVLLPGSSMPLHVFEPRFQTMIERCLGGTRAPEFGVVLIERGSEVGGGDTRGTIGTAGRIVEATRFDDGRWALLITGTTRIRVERWLADDPYPQAEVSEIVEPPLSSTGEQDFATMVTLLRRVLAMTCELGDSSAPATIEFATELVLGSFQAAASAPLGPADQQRVLEATGASERIALLHRLLADEELYLQARLRQELS